MYIMVTTRCNMQCAHCQFACVPGKGKDMSLETFKRAVELAADYDSYIAIGGGEPTLNPNLLLMIGYATMLSAEEQPPFMVTNGTCDQKTWAILMRAAKRKNLDLHVSKDPWHDWNMVQDWVIDDADAHDLWWGTPYEQGSGSTRRIVTLGRAKSREAQEQLKDDALKAGYRDVSFEAADCDDISVEPDGTVFVYVPNKKRIGPLSADNLGKAFDILDNYRDRHGL